jgi:uncharacterized protein (DUF488 family)
MIELEAMPVYTVGHSNHTIDQLVALLRRHSVGAVADVRSTPYSRWQPQFNREALRAALARHDVDYVFLGAELGGRGAESVRDDAGRTRYREIARTAAFRDGLRRVRDGSRRMSLALMCKECDPLECHRGILVSRALGSLGTAVVHIHANGRLERHADAEQRLLRTVQLHAQDLFRTEEQILTDAYERQEARIAYVMPDASAAM